ncbi:hypothetical protein [Micromonospora ureilytica]|uniref:hypothetical protein n=1 Tax=Micromonospora ureilytica TaxID=709868 RepID=UPI002E1548CB|nr:hypothetical protein OHB55_19155 [Micromonospora ureilytica]
MRSGFDLDEATPAAFARHLPHLLVRPLAIQQLPCGRGDNVRQRPTKQVGLQSFLPLGALEGR